MKRIINTVLSVAIIACMIATQCVFAAEKRTPAASVAVDNNTACITVTVEDVLSNDQVFIQVFPHTDRGISSNPEFGYVYNADEDGNLTAKIIIPNATSSLKTVWVKPRVGKLLKLEPVAYYASNDINGFKTDWNDAIDEVDSTDKMTAFVKTARNINIAFDTTLGSELSASMQNVSADTLVAELKTKQASDDLETIKGYFKGAYKDFVLKNLNDKAAAKFVDQLYDEIVSPVEGDVHYDIIIKMDSDSRISIIEKALLNSDNLVSLSDFKKNLYIEAIFNQFKNIEYANEIMPLIKKYNTEYLDIDMTKYDKLISPGSVASGLKSSQASIKDFNDLKTKFNELVDDQREKEEDAKDEITKPRPSTFGGGIAVSSSNTEITTEFNNIREVTDTIFDDLNGFGWAQEHIMSLYNKGAIDGVGGKRFAPADKVTREQAVKMLFSLVSSQEETVGEGFADVSVGMWYSEFVNSAKTLGIVSGKTDGTFGVGEYITRQDLAVMLVNTIKVEDETKLADIKVQKMNFGDAESISSYAIYAVSVLNKLGIITGDEVGNFSPLAGASRAEAAVMISRVMKLLD